MERLLSYGASVKGPSHMDRDIPCQDCYSISNANEGYLILGVSDGLGSESHSDIGSEVAVKRAVAYISGAISAGQLELMDIMDVLRESFSIAYEDVIVTSEALGEDLGEFDCTLCVAVYDGKTAWYGQSGDSGLIVCKQDGSYQMVTQIQRDDEGRVYPLCFEDRWVFGISENVSSLLLATDGVLLDVIAPPVLSALWGCPIDTEIAHQFLHTIPEDQEGAESLGRYAAQYLAGLPREIVDDDKTLVFACNVDCPPGDMGADYYAGPDWNLVMERMREAEEDAKADLCKEGEANAEAVGDASSSEVEKLNEDVPYFETENPYMEVDGAGWSALHMAAALAHDVVPAAIGGLGSAALHAGRFGRDIGRRIGGLIDAFVDKDSARTPRREASCAISASADCIQCETAPEPEVASMEHLSGCVGGISPTEEIGVEDGSLE